MPEQPLFASIVISSRKTNRISFRKFFHVMFLYILHVSSEKYYYAFAGKPDKFFCTRVKENDFPFAGKRLEHLENREILCVQRPKILIFSVDPVNKSLRECIRCLYNNVVDRLFQATSKSTNDRRVQTLWLDIIQLALIQALTVL